MYDIGTLNIVIMSESSADSAAADGSVDRRKPSNSKQ